MGTHGTGQLRLGAAPQYEDGARGSHEADAGQVVRAALAHVLGELGNNEAADVAYRYLADRLPPDHPLALRLKLQQATVALNTGRLADGDDILRRLRGQAESSNDPSLGAAFRLARLVQDVNTGHYADAIEEADDTANALIPLGVEAGYGYALLALCCALLAEHDPSLEDDRRIDLAKQAKAHWNKATLLIPPAALVYRYPELQKISFIEN